MIARKLGLLGHAVLPHVVGELVAVSHRGLQRLGIKLTNAPWREDCGFYGVRFQQLQQAPNANPPAKLPLGQLHGRLVVEAPQQHGIKVDRHIDGDARRVGPSQRSEQRKTRLMLRCRAFQLGNFLAEPVRHAASQGRDGANVSAQARARWQPFCTTLALCGEIRMQYSIATGNGKRRFRQQTKGPSRMEDRASEIDLGRG